MAKTLNKGECTKSQVLAPFIDMIENRNDEGEAFVGFLDHCGIDVSGVTNIETQLLDCVAAHYFIRPGVYDLDRVANHLITWPPIATRIAEIQEQQARKGRGKSRGKPRRDKILS